MAQQNAQQEVSVSVRNTAVLIASIAETILLLGTFLAGFGTALWVVGKFLRLHGTVNDAWMAAITSTHISFAIISGFGAALLLALSYLSGRKELFYLSLVTIIGVGFAAAMGLAFNYAITNPVHPWLSYAMGMTVVVPLASTVGCIVYSLSK